MDPIALLGSVRSALTAHNYTLLGLYFVAGFILLGVRSGAPDKFAAWVAKQPRLAALVRVLGALHLSFAEIALGLYQLVTARVVQAGGIPLPARASGGIYYAVVNESTLASDAQVQKWVDAVRAQLAEDVAPHWPEAANIKVACFPDVDCAPSGAFIVVILDDETDPGALGHHQEGRAVIGVRDCQLDGVDPGEVLSHELVETPEDLHLNRWVPAPNGEQEIVEICDPTQGTGYVKNGQRVANFALPSRYKSDGQPPFDFRGALSAPFALTPDGYASRLKSDGSVQEIGAARKSRQRHRADKIKALRGAKSGVLARAARRIAVALAATLLLGCSASAKAIEKSINDVVEKEGCIFLAPLSANAALAAVCATEPEIDTAIDELIDALPTTGSQLAQLHGREAIAAQILADRAKKATTASAKQSR